MYRNFSSALRGFLVSIGLIVGGTPSSIGFAEEVRRSACDYMGRIVDGSGDNFADGDLICPGTELRFQPGTSVQFLCFINGRVLLLSGERVYLTNQCDSAPSNSSSQACEDTLCSVPKGPESEEVVELAIIEPQPVTTNPYPTIRWTPVESADRYVIFITAYNFTWRTVTTDVELTYPTSESPLQVNAYEITVIAYRADQEMASAKIVFNVQS